MASILNCTATSPMPEGESADMWYHHGAQPLPGEPLLKAEGDKQVWHCPNCGLEFEVRRGAKCTHAEAIAKVKAMREKGWNPNA